MYKYSLFILLILCGINLKSQNSVEISFSRYQSFRMLIYDQNNEILKKIATAREIDDKKVGVFEFGVNKFWKYNTYINLGLGLNYSRMGYHLNEISGYRWPSEITATGYKFDPSLPHELRLSNFVSYIEIPIIVEYNSNSKIQFSPSISLVNQLYLNSLSRVKTDLGSSSSSGRDDIVSPYNIAFVGNLAIGYRINDFVLKLGLSYKNQLFVAINEDIQEKLFSYGWNLSTRYLLK